MHVSYCFGTWTLVITSHPSNYQEFLNMVMEIEMKVEQGKLHKGTELFMFTNSFTTESVFSLGMLSLPLYELILRLHKVLMNGNIFVHVIWVACKCMITQGVDGLSHGGDLTNGVMSSKLMLDFTPLHLFALQCQEHHLKCLLDSCF